jgi:hypothetical protein
MSTATAPRFRPQRARKGHVAGRDVPPLWTLVATRWFACNPNLAAEVWHEYQRLWPHSSKSTAFELNRLFSGSQDHGVLWQRAERLLAVLCPKDMLAASLRLSPAGNRRRRDVLSFEEAVLERLDGDGKWRIL